MIQFYKPNKKVTGTACSFSFNEVEGSFWAELVKQKSWDDSKRVCRFHSDADKKVKIKFSRLEICDMIHALKSNSEFSAYHSNPKQVCQIKFAPFFNKEKVQMGFSIGVNKEAKDDSTNKQFFSIGFRFNEMEELLLWFQYAVNLDFEIKRKARIKEYSKKKKESEAQQEPQQEPEPAKTQTDDDSDIW